MIFYHTIFFPEGKGDFQSINDRFSEIISAVIFLFSILEICDIINNMQLVMAI